MAKTACFAAAGLALAAVLAAAELPVVASHLVTGPSSYVELTNNGTQPATAWSVVITTEENGRVHRAVQTRDTYIAEVTRGLPGSQEELDWLLPGATRRMSLDPVPVGADAQVLAVVMEDGSSAGDARAIELIFERRAAERDALRNVVDAFRIVLPTAQGVKALEELQARLERLSSGETAHRAAAQAIAKFLQQAKSGAENDANQGLRKYAAFVERQYDVAVKHARRKP
jgi:hypothetical protein